MNNTNKFDESNNDSDELKLQLIEPTDKQIEILYDFLRIRNFPISHTNLPEFNEHKEFVINNPYRVWMLIYQRKIPIGTIYISNDNSIGISLKTNSIMLMKSLIKKVLENYKPLPAIKSIRGNNFHININPSDKKLISIIKKIGLVHIQSTYSIS